MSSRPILNVYRLNFTVFILSVLLTASVQAAEPATETLLPAPAKNNPIASTITAGLNVTAAVGAIQAQGYDMKERLAAEVERRLKVSASRLNELKASASGLTELGKTEFEKGVKDAEVRQSEVEKCLFAVLKVPSDGWDMARAELAGSYALYVEAIARAEIGLMKTIAPPAVSTDAAQINSASTSNKATPPRS